MKFKPLVIVLLMFSTVGAQAQVRHSRRSINPVGPAAANVAAQVAGQTLPIRRITLYSNGVAYIERRGAVTGHAEVNLSFKQSQVDDVLKSMVVLDLGEGRIGAVSYNSSAPPAARMADIPFTIQSETDNDLQGGLAGVLSQLQGARVTVTTNARTVSGSILTVEERKSQIDADKPALTTHALVIASENGELASFDLAEVRSVRLLDEGARRDVSEFASATASARRRDAKTITVTSDGAGSREMVVSYTVAAPIWKTTYRVVLDSAGKPFFQGWAIVDNVSEEDWTNVQLSLVSGTPISFIQPIQKPFYRYRPVVPMPEDLRLNPQVYEPGENVVLGSRTMSGVNRSSELVTVTAEPPAPVAAPGISMRGRNAMANNLLLNGASGEEKTATSLSDAIIEDKSVETAATGSEIGDLFEYRIDQPVTVRRDRSALIPILQTRMEGERVSIFNETARADRPMSGMLLRNSSALTLEDGSMTVIDGDAYAGEALIERLKPGEQRLISFALDLGTLVTVRAKEDRSPTLFVRTVGGVLEVHYYGMNRKTYTLTNQTEHPRLIYIEHPIRAGWTLSDDTPKPDGKSRTHYRFRVMLEPHQAFALNVAERQELMETYALTDLNRPTLELFISRRYVDDATRAALEKIIDLKTRITSVDVRLAAIDKEVEAITQDQQRLRENIKALTATAEARQLIARYVAKAGEQETRLEQLTKDRQQASDERARLQQELDAAIRSLNIDRTLNRG
ncbi:MAG TPA: hypothetical protein VGO91_11525 [Pyrinomonadaceae bacterium]|jgi:hypothetical protein|nr:hypothetical protein [Pyrinomonadaceae bacterium]